MSQTHSAVCRLRSSFRSGKTKQLSWRIQQLKNLKRFAFEKQDAIVQALYKDLRKPEFETKVTELSMVFEDVELALDNIHKWVKPRSVSKPNYLIWGMDKIQKVPEPYGVVLIVSPWNYPVQLSLVAMIGAIAAGNCIILKPSELAPSIEKLFCDFLPQYLDQDCFAVITGGPQETQELLDQKFDYILYTGSTAVGKIVMSAASKHLTPVTLELGGKSPCIIDATVDMKTAANRIAWGKLINAGQSCIAPDYILVEQSVHDDFIRCYAASVRNMLGDNPQKSDSYARIVNNRHWKRITALMENCDIAFGGENDENDLYIAPTVITGVSSNDPIMEQEIFGPLLPVIRFTKIDEATDFINDRDKPLALYLFSRDQSTIEFVGKNTSSGAFTVNDTMVHAGCNTLKFGGVGPSGIGGYHGEHSFKTFSHMKPTLYKFPGLEGLNDVRVAPFTAKKLKTFLWFVGYPTSLHSRKLFLPLLKYLSVGLGIAVLFYFLQSRA